MKRLAKSQDKKVMGVAGGIAEYTNTDPTLWRAIALIGLFVFPPTFFIYLILGFVLPEGEREWQVLDPEPGMGEGHAQRVKRMTRSENQVIAGVAAGLAEYLDIDPTVVRVLFVLAIFFGVGFLAYVALWIVMPRPRLGY